MILKERTEIWNTKPEEILMCHQEKTNRNSSSMLEGWQQISHWIGYVEMHLFEQLFLCYIKWMHEYGMNPYNISTTKQYKYLHILLQSYKTKLHWISVTKVVDYNLYYTPFPYSSGRICKTILSVDATWDFLVSVHLLAH